MDVCVKAMCKTTNSLPKALQHDNDSEDEPSQSLTLESQCIVGNVVEAEDHFCCIFPPKILS